MVYITESAELDHYRFSEDDLVPLLANLCEALQDLDAVMAPGPSLWRGAVAVPV